MTFYKKKWFKYLKNLLIGIGASLVMLGALGKINSEPWGGLAITVGLVTEAIIFLVLGLLPPEKDYYWDKLYPGLGDYHSNIASITQGGSAAAELGRPINGEVVETQLDGMLGELRTLSKSIGSLKALQEVDFSETGQQIKAMNNFYTRMTEAMSTLNETVEDTKHYKENLTTLNHNLSSLNSVYGNILNAYNQGPRV